jgi:predicted transcriptional regulator
MKLKSYTQFKKESLKNKDVKRAYDEFSLEFSLIEDLIGERIKSGITQKELAEKIGTKQSAVSRFESGRGNPTFSFLMKVSNALGKKIEVSVK